MRYLYTVMPGSSHLYPLVPSIRAARLAGHDVLVATSGAAVRSAVEAGLPVIDTARDHEIAPVFDKMRTDVLVPDLSDDELMGIVAGAFATIGDRMMEGLLSVARAWRPDVVVYEPGLAAGLICAREIGVPAVVHGVGLRHPTMWSMYGMAPTVQRLGLAELPENPDAEVCVSPASVEALNEVPGEDRSVVTMVDMRPTAFSGGGEVPSWALTRGERPRVVVTLGSAMGTSRERRILSDTVLGAAALDTEVVVTTGGAELPAESDTWPDNVRVVSWLPMSELLPVTDAVIHHAGMGTMYAAYAAGVPQVSVPPNGGQPSPDAVAAARGVGLTLRPAELTSEAVTEAVRRLLTEPAFRAASQEVAAEIAAMPGPSAAMDEITRLVSSGALRGGSRVGVS